MGSHTVEVWRMPRTPSPRATVSDPEGLTPGEGAHGKARDLRRQGAALSAARAAAAHYARLLLLAGEPGGLAVVPAAGRVRAQDRLRLVRELPRAASPGRLLPRHGDHGDLLHRRGRALAVDRAAAGRAGRQEHQGRRPLQDAADLALCRRPRHRRRAVAVHVPAVARAGGARPALARHGLEPAAQRQSRHGAGGDGRRPGSRSATISCSSSPACSRSRAR